MTNFLLDACQGRGMVESDLRRSLQLSHTLSEPPPARRPTRRSLSTARPHDRKEPKCMFRPRPPRIYKLISLLVLLLLGSACARPALHNRRGANPMRLPSPMRSQSPIFTGIFLFIRASWMLPRPSFRQTVRTGTRSAMICKSRLGFSDADYAPIRTASQRLGVRTEADQ